MDSYSMVFEKIFEVPETPWKEGLRKACRGVLIDENCQIPLLFVSRENYYKLPWWWMEWDEDKIETLRREVLEEAGCEIDSIKEIWYTVEKNSTWSQISYCFVSRVVNKWNAEYTSEEIYDWFTLKWVKREEALAIMKDIVPSTENGKRKQERESFILENALKEIG